MNLPEVPTVFHQYTDLSEVEATRLSYAFGGKEHYTVEVKPPLNSSHSLLENFVRGVQEIQSKYLGLVNTSPVTSFEIRRVNNSLSFQFTAPTKRLERKIRSQLSAAIPDIGFDDGTNGLPVAEDVSVGGGMLTTGCSDALPLKTSYDSPPLNSLTASLHRHAMKNTSIVIQILFQPVAGKPLRRWLWRKSAYRKSRFLRKEKEKLWGTVSPTKREKQQADSVERKAAETRFKTSIRIVVVGAGEYTGSRVKEISGAFNVFENPDTGQYFDTITVTPIRQSQIYSFCNAVADRKYAGWSNSFHTTSGELAALVSIPDRQQDNITPADP